MYLDLTESELEQISEEILTIMGAFTIDVDIRKEEIVIFLRWGLREFEKETSIWQINNQFGNVYGMPAGNIMTNQLATMNMQLVNQIADWFGSMARVGGKIPWHKDYINLEAGRQIYDLSLESSKPYISGSRRIHRVMWVAKPDIFNGGRYSTTNPNGDDILYSNSWNFSANGLNYGTSALGYMGYTVDMILMMQHVEQRNKVMFSEFSHNLSGDILEITPMPGGNAGVVNGSKVFYYYFDESEVAMNGRNPELYKSSTISGSLGANGLPPGESSLIANPLDVNIDFIPWSRLSQWARQWISAYVLAQCKYSLGAKQRKMKKTMAQGENDYEIEFDYQSLLSEANEEISRLREELRNDLKDISVVKMLQDKAEMAIAAGKVTTRVPRMWKFQ